MLVHIVIVVLLTGFAMAKTGSTDPGRWERFLRCRVYDVYCESILLRIQVVCHLHYTLSTVQCFLSVNKL